jgi:hypothetical protein
MDLHFPHDPASLSNAAGYWQADVSCLTPGYIEESAMTVHSCFWRNKWLTAEARTIEEMIAGLRGAADELQAMQEAGVTLLDDGAAADDYARLVTDDPAVAARFGFEEEEDDDDEDEG